MPEQTPPATDTKPNDAEQPPAVDASKAAPDPRAELTKLSKTELVDRVLAAKDDVAFLDGRLRELNHARRARPEDAMVVSALLDLHRTVGAEARQGSTIRGRKAETTAPRYLEAARALGDELVTAILGPNAKV